MINFAKKYPVYLSLNIPLWLHEFGETSFMHSHYIPINSFFVKIFSFYSLKSSYNSSFWLYVPQTSMIFTGYASSTDFVSYSYAHFKGAKNNDKESTVPSPYV